VAAVPEGLPIVATLAMARGMLRMARQNALVNRLAAVETLGGTTVICTDKTGTLTENEMTVTRIVLPTGAVVVKESNSEDQRPFERDGMPVDPTDDQSLQLALRIGVLCNNASRENGGRDGWVGDPLEVALLDVGGKAGLNRHALLQQNPEVREEAFDTTTKMMATLFQANTHFEVAVKGAPEAVIDRCTKIRRADENHPLDSVEKERWLRRNQALARDGLRVLALATKTIDTSEGDPYRDLSLVGLLGLMDPPRRSVKPAIASCQKAGLSVVMVTGDQAETALNIASEVGLFIRETDSVIEGDTLHSTEGLSASKRERCLKASVFARVTPEQKLDLIQIHQDAGAIVAMTGDGVNDAPALRKADIGVAMGQRGTQVAREAADMVLKDDSFATIVMAIKEGRIIFSNIRKFIVYLLSGNASEIMIVFAASLVNIPLPILPLQILLLNVISDVFPALALGLGGGSDDVMKRPPRNPQEPILAGSHWLAIFGYGVLIATSVLAVFVLAIYPLGIAKERAVTIAFLTLAFARLWHVFNMRELKTRLTKNEITSNPIVWAALALCTSLLLTVVYLPGLSTVLKLTIPSGKEWLLIIGASFVPFVLGQSKRYKCPKDECRPRSVT
jgi:Ca2+-transporting ATPase